MTVRFHRAMADKHSILEPLGAAGPRSFHAKAKPGNLDCKYGFYLGKECLPKGLSMLGKP